MSTLRYLPVEKNFTIHMGEEATSWGLSLCTPATFRSLNRFRTPCDNGVELNMVKFDVDGGCNSNATWMFQLDADTPPTWFDDSRSLYVYYKSVDLRQRIHLEVACDPAVTQLTVTSAAYAPHSAAVLKIDASSMTVCPGYPPPPRTIKVSWSVIFGGCILGVTFIGLVCVTRRWARQEREEYQGYKAADVS